LRGGVIGSSCQVLDIKALDRLLEYKRNWNKEFYRKNKQAERERIYKRKKKIAKWFEEYKSSLSCEKCGEKAPVCLDFHHRKQGKKDFNIDLAKNWG